MGIIAIALGSMTYVIGVEKNLEKKVTDEEVPWTREDVQRVLYEVVRAYEGANSYHYTLVKDGKEKEKKTPRRFILFGRRLPFLGGDSEFLLNRIEIARKTLKANGWWPEDDE